MSQSKAVTKGTATRCRSASKGAKVVILDECVPPPAGIATTPVKRYEKRSDRAGCSASEDSTSDLRRGCDGGATQGV